MSTYERLPMKGKLWIQSDKKYETSCDISGWIKVPPCSEEKEYTIRIWDNRESKYTPTSPDYGVQLKDPAEVAKVPNGGTEALRSGQSSSYTPGADSREKEGDDLSW